MIRSRVTLAITEAAAIEKLKASPVTTVLTAQDSGGGTLPSTSAISGTSPSAATARRIARRLARRMLMRSISRVLAAPTPILAQRSRASKQASRASRVMAFESSSSRRTMPRNRWRSRITAAATTGPASGPRPASSTPHTTPAQPRSIAKSGIAFALPPGPPPRVSPKPLVPRGRGRRKGHPAATLAAPELQPRQRARLDQTKAYYDWFAGLSDAERDRRFRERFDQMDSNHDGVVDPAERAAWHDKQRAFFSRGRTAAAEPAAARQPR